MNEEIVLIDPSEFQLSEALLSINLAAASLLRAEAPSLREPATSVSSDQESGDLSPGDILALDGNEELGPHFDDATNFSTAAGTSAEVGGNGIFVLYEAPAQFAGLDAVGALSAA